MNRSRSRESIVARSDHIGDVNDEEEGNVSVITTTATAAAAVPQLTSPESSITTTTTTTTTATATSPSLSSPQSQPQPQPQRSRFMLGMMRGIFSNSSTRSFSLRNQTSRRHLDTTTNITTTATTPATSNHIAPSSNVSSHYTTNALDGSNTVGEEMFHSPLSSSTTLRYSDETTPTFLNNHTEQFYTPRDNSPSSIAAADLSMNQNDAGNEVVVVDHIYYPSSPPSPLPQNANESHPSSPLPLSSPTEQQQPHEELLAFTSIYNDDFDHHHHHHTVPDSHSYIPSLPSASSHYYEYFYPNISTNYEYMGRSIESLLFSHAVARAPILLLPLDSIPDDLSISNSNHPHHKYHRRSSTGGTSVNSNTSSHTQQYPLHYSNAVSLLSRAPPQRRRHSSLDSFVGHIRSSISSNIPIVTNPNNTLRGGGTLANYHRSRRRRVSTSSASSSTHVRIERRYVERRQSSSALPIPRHHHQQQQQRRRNSSIGIDIHSQEHRNYNSTPVNVIVPNNVYHHLDHPRRNSSITSTYQTQQPTILQQLQQHRSTKRNHLENHDRSGGPNVVLNILARESTGKSIYPRATTMSSSYNEIQKLKCVTGVGFIKKYINEPSRGMVTEIELLANAIDNGDWNETHRCINRLETRLISNSDTQSPSTSSNQQHQQGDPTLPRNAHRYYAGGGRNGYDRDIFTLCGGVSVLLRIFFEKAFVGQEMSESYDARDLTTNIVTTRLAPCWIDVLSLLRELIIYIPSLMDDTALVGDSNFLPLLFTLLVHDTLFDAAATLIEEMLSIMSQTQQDATAVPPSHQLPDTIPFPPTRPKPTMTFYMGNISDLYKLWRGFNCRQLAHFCRILAFLIFEPEDRQLLESPTVLRSIELLQLRRNRTVRSGYDSTVDMNQSILLGDETIIRRLLVLLRTMNYAPSLSRLAHCNGMSLFPVVADTLFMVGLNEIESWSELDRQDTLARTILFDSSDEPLVRVCDLGALSDMLETFMNTISGNESRVPPTHVSHIIQVLSAAQQAGVIVGRNRPPRRQRNRSFSDRNNPTSDAGSEINNGQATEIPVDDETVQGLASAAGILSEQVFIRRFFGLHHQDGSAQISSDEANVNVDSSSGHRYMINAPEDAANSLQFNAMLLGPYHVEVLFVLCTLLGGRRKLDAQDMMYRHGIVPVMDDMIERLPWSTRHINAIAPALDQSNHSGIHGPGCECTQENALCIQYLRLLHNFCDRDCENYGGRQELLSCDEQEYINAIKAYDTGTTKVQVSQELPSMKYGLLRKIIDAFIGESDESSYRFWLASCIEAFLRGSSMAEQMFVAQVGLMDHLLDEICSNRLHCAGSLQTSFDLLGEVGKGNEAVMELMINSLDEVRLHKLMRIASMNLVDSNVFLRSMFIGVERSAAMRIGTAAMYMDVTSSQLDFVSLNEEYHLYQRSITGYFLSFSWWDTPTIPILTSSDKIPNVGSFADGTPTDWFPPLDLLQYCYKYGVRSDDGAWHVSDLAHKNRINVPNSIERMHWFIHTNQAQLLYDLLSVVSLRNINHENICCLNTAVVVTIFAYRRNELCQLVHDLCAITSAPSDKHQQPARGQRFQYGDITTANELVHGIQALRILDESHTGSKYYHRISTGTACHQILYNFREVLWFWVEYYTHRGRDRLSLEYSSRLRYDDWISVVTILITYLDNVLLTGNNDDVDSNASDKVSPSAASSILLITTDRATSSIKYSLNTTLVSSRNTCPLVLPRSPYQRAAHVVVGNEFVSLRSE